MRSLYKISLAVLAVGILAFAGSASAQDKPNFTLGADIGVGFGQIAFDKTTTNVTGTADANSKAFSELTTSWETNLTFNWATDSLRVYSRLRIRGSTEGSGGTGTAAANSSASLAALSMRIDWRCLEAGAAALSGVVRSASAARRPPRAFRAG